MQNLQFKTVWFIYIINYMGFWFLYW